MNTTPVALVTGASRGIGRGIALALARLGYSVVVNYRADAASAQQTVDACGKASGETGASCMALPCQADIANATDRSRLLDFTRTQFGRLDVLVNNAGVAPEVRMDLLETTESSMDRLLGINLKGPFFLTQQAARWMIEQAPHRGTSAPSLKIITISSISSYTTSLMRGEYCISKAALSMMTPLFAARLAEHGIQVFELRPGLIETDMTSEVKPRYDGLIAGGLTPIRRWGTPEDVGRAVAAIASDGFPFSTGDAFNVDGGFHLRRL